MHRCSVSKKMYRKAEHKQMLSNAPGIMQVRFGLIRLMVKTNKQMTCSQLILETFRERYIASWKANYSKSDTRLLEILKIQSSWDKIGLKLAAWILRCFLVYPRRLSMKQIVLASYSPKYANESSKWPQGSQSLNPRESFQIILSHINLHFIIDSRQRHGRVPLPQVVIPASVIQIPEFLLLVVCVGV